MEFLTKQYPLENGKWMEALTMPAENRPGYELTDSKITTIQVAGLILGVPEEKINYREMLYELAYDCKNVSLYTTGNFDSQFSNSQFQQMQRVLSSPQLISNYSASRLVSMLDDEGLLPLKGNPAYYVHLRKSCIEVLRTFELHHGGLENPGFVWLVMDLIKYIHNHITGTNTNKFIWYGDATQNETYFLLLLYKLGKDILIFHPEGKNIFQGIIQLPAFKYPKTAPVEAVPTSRPKREATIARNASEELEEILTREDAYLFKPWQFRDHTPQAINLHTTYDEVSLISREKAFVRPGFEVRGKKIYVPVLFSKICGMPSDKAEYAKLYEKLLEGKLVVGRQRFPFSWEISTDQDFNYEGVLTKGRLDPLKLLESSKWQFRHLPSGLQYGLAQAIFRYVQKAEMKPLPGEDVRRYLFTQAMELPKDMVFLLQQYDYAQEIPRLVLFNNGGSGQISRADAARLLLLNEFGVDIIILSPTGQNDIETYIQSHLFDVHWQEKLSFGEEHQSLLSLARQTKGPKVKKMFKNFMSKG